jgi:hypothetical protein
MINRILAAAAFLCVLGLSFTGSLLVQDYLATADVGLNITVIQKKRVMPAIMPPADCFQCREA